MIVDAMTLSQLQTTLHLIQQMEADGVRSLNDARRRITRAIETQHAEIIRSKRGARPRRDYRGPVHHCSQCGQKTIVTMADGLAIRACRACRWSEVVEVNA